MGAWRSFGKEGLECIWWGNEHRAMVTRSCCSASSGSWCLAEVPSAGFGVGEGTGNSPTRIPAGAPVAVSLPLDQIMPDLMDQKTEGKLNTQGFTRPMML